LLSDETLDAGRGQAVTAGTDAEGVAATYLINADLGVQLGGNLIHSFREFNVAQGETATFSGPSSVQNIISRVTGGTPSSIDGTLRSTTSGSSLYFLNPAGILFGANAKLDLPGSSYASTATGSTTASVRSS